MRLFVGIAITEEIRKSIAAYALRLENAMPDVPAKWVRPESLHVTLKFIGESEKVAEIQDQLKSLASPPVTMRFRNVGFFSPRKPRVFWLGVEAGPELEKLATSIDERLVRVGVPKEPHTYQEYQPHITLARVGSGRPQPGARDRNKATMKALQDFVAKQLPPDFGTMTADEFILFRSETLPGGSVYTPLKRFPLS